MLVEQVMTAPALTASLENSVRSAASRMECLRIGSLVVVNDEGCPVGIITSRDVRCAHPNRLVADAMTREMVSIEPGSTIWAALGQMEQAQVERLPVVRDRRLLGIVTQATVMREVGRYTDGLTGLPSSAFLRAKAYELLNAADDVALIFFDLNHFGLVNKQCGHVVGDQCLRDVASVIRRHCVDCIDWACRYGGDEFTVVSLRTEQEAKEWAQTVAAAVANLPSSSETRLSVSAGVVGGRRLAQRSVGADENVEQLIALASRLSTKAKASAEQVVLSSAAG